MSHRLRWKIHEQRQNLKRGLMGPALWIVRFIKAAAVLLPLFWAIEATAKEALLSQPGEDVSWVYFASLEPQQHPGSAWTNLEDRVSSFEGDRDPAYAKLKAKRKASFLRKLIPHWYFGQMALKPGLEESLEDKSKEKSLFRAEKIRAQENIYFDKNTSSTFRSDPALLPSAAVLLNF